MNPYYQDESVTLYCGDVREILPRLERVVCVDVIIADPPYGETSLSWDKWPEGWPSLLFGISNSLWCFGSLRMFMAKSAEFQGWKLSHDIVWEKQNGSSLHNDRFRRIHEQVAHFYRAGVPWGDVYKKTFMANNAARRTVRRKTLPPHWGRIADSSYSSIDGGPRMVESVIYAANCHGYAIHPTQKPEDIIIPILEYSCPQGGTVLDLFAGSGTTAKVARQSGRNAISIEGSEENCEKIVKRLQESFC